MIVLMGANFIQIAEVIIVELMQVHVSIAFDHIFAFVRVCGVFEVIFDIVPLVECSFRSVLHGEVMNGIPVLASVHSVEVGIGDSRHVVPSPSIRRGIGCAPKNRINVSKSK